MTWWAAVLGFAGALAGSWGGQIIASRREDRRWTREQQREELRWQRDRDKQREVNEHDLRKHWSEQRLHAYQACLTAFDLWRTFLGEEAEMFVDDADQPMEQIEAAINKKAVSMINSVSEAVDRVQVIGSLDSIHAAAECFHCFHDLHHQVMSFMERNVSLDPLTEIKDLIEVVATDAMAAMRKGFRHDFGFES